MGWTSSLIYNVLLPRCAAAIAAARVFPSAGGLCRRVLQQDLGVAPYGQARLRLMGGSSSDELDGLIHTEYETPLYVTVPCTVFVIVDYV